MKPKGNVMGHRRADSGRINRTWIPPHGGPYHTTEMIDPRFDLTKSTAVDPAGCRMSRMQVSPYTAYSRPPATGD